MNAGSLSSGARSRWLKRRPAFSRPASGGFTLIEVMLVVALIAVVVGMATFALRNSEDSRLEEEGARLSALLESARARARAMGLDVRWQPLSESRGFAFQGLPATMALPSAWLDTRTQAEVVGGRALRLGPEPVIGAQQVRLRLENRSLLLATDGLGPFTPSAEGVGPANPGATP